MLISPDWNVILLIEGKLEPTYALNQAVSEPKIKNVLSGRHYQKVKFTNQQTEYQDDV
jgi:hypothetical protein